MKKTLVVGLTGQSGAGKSTVSQLMAQEGCTIIDADEIARQVVSDGTDCLVGLALAFGCEILNQDGTLNRRRLGNLVFGDKKKTQKLNQTILPYILREIQRQVDLARQRGGELVILDAPTLFESGADQFCDQIVSVIAPEQMRYNRVLLRDDRTEEEIRARFASQHEDAYYTKRSQFVISNDKNRNHLAGQTWMVLEKLRQLQEKMEKSQ